MKFATIATIVFTLVVASLATPMGLHARQFVVNQGGRSQVVHTRRAPVILHRALPPFRGQHIYQPGR